MSLMEKTDFPFFWIPYFPVLPLTCSVRHCVPCRSQKRRRWHSACGHRKNPLERETCNKNQSTIFVILGLLVFGTAQLLRICGAKKSSKSKASCQDVSVVQSWLKVPASTAVLCESIPGSEITVFVWIVWETSEITGASDKESNDTLVCICLVCCSSLFCFRWFVLVFHTRWRHCVARKVVRRCRTRRSCSRPENWIEGSMWDAQTGWTSLLLETTDSNRRKLHHTTWR